MRRTPVLSRRLARRLTASVTAAVVTAGLLVAVAPATPAAAAGGPSVGQPDTPSVPVTAQGMDPRPADPATRQALSGDQPAGGTPGGGAGAPTATSLSPSATWTVSPQTGDFAWSYPLRTPPVPGGLAPELAFSYRSSTVDGRTSTTNNQPSWVGDGWDLNPGFVERTYGPCAADKDGGTQPPADKGDLCWRSDNATASYSAGGGVLIRDAATGGWRSKQDDGSRVERLTGAGNGDNNGEYWKITTVDGIQYFFGSRAAAVSTWTVPVFGDDTGEPCHGSTLAGSRCTQAWRWNLDKVVDPNGNQILLNYQAETNSYGVDAALSYVRGGYLRGIDYGLHTSAASQPAARVLFGVADRCVPGSTCALDRPENWPDTPLDERCTGTACQDSPSPTFWSTKRLATVTTQVRGSDGGFENVDRWSLDHQFPAPGDGEKAALWLKSITHTGLVGGEAELPPVTFEGAAMPNRVHQADGLSPLLRYRITGIVSESGGLVSVVYAPPDCVPGQSMPDLEHADSNTHRCFPVTWARPGHAERTDWFHKYVVESVTLSDRISSNLEQQVSYQYLGGAAWHYDTSEFTPKDKRTWNEFRGFARVRVSNGRTPDPGGPVSMSEQRFFRGMDQDRTSGGGRRSVTVADTEGGSFPDHDWLQGTERESITYLGDSATVVDKTITDPVWRGPTATRGDLKAYQVHPGTVRTFTPLAGGGRRVTKQVTSYDDRGLPTAMNDLGDVSLAADDLCTRTTYVRNTAGWLLSAPSREQTVSVHCGADPSFPDDAVSDRRTSYDGQAWGAAPRAGNPTRVEVLAEHPATGPVYQVQSTTSYDPHGRPTAVTDALDRTTRTAYTPATGGPTTRTVVTDPIGFATTVDLHPALGEPVTVTDVNGNSTDTAYDPLGRVSEVWQPDRARKWGFASSYRFSYLIRREAPTVVTTTAIGPNGTYTSTNELYDGLLRRRQVQQPAVGGGRLLTDVRYDSQGRVYKSTNPYFNDAPVDTTLWVASDVEIPGHTLTEFDGAGRPTASIQMAGAVPLWQSTTSYGGDRVHVTPPPGGTATTTVQDARGNTVALHEYHSGSPTGPSDVTRYGYTPAGHLASVTDPAGNTWRYRYDLRGNLVHTDDPDKGEVTSRFDPAGQLTSRTDARDQTLAYDYDELGRMQTIRSGGAGGRVLAEWTYDTVPRAKGHPATATSYDQDGNAYTSEVQSYTARYQPRRTAITIPPAEGLLAGSYETSVSYNPDGSVLGESFPAAGDLFEEEVFHTYDDAGRPLTTYGGPEGSTITYASQTDYTRYGEQQRLQLGTGTSRAWLSTYYDGPTRRIERTIVDAEVPRPMQSDRHYRYDPAGNVTSIADTPAEQPADVQCFRYDHLRRLTDAWTPAGDCATDPAEAELGGPAPYRQSYTFDLVGNRLSQVEHTAGGDVTRSYTYPDPGADLPHALSSVTTTGPAGATTSSYQYDPAGNTTARGGQRLRWDEQGRLASVTEDGEATEYVHDAVGQRLIRRGPEATTLYLGDQEVQLDHATGELTGTRYYGHGGRTIAVRTGAGLAWLFQDHHGTAEVAIDSGTLTATVRRHDPFGNRRGGEPASWPGEQGFVGGPTDERTGLTQLGAREYDPRHGRFISVDPILDPAQPQQLNAYAYANNSPVTMTDPDGLKYFVDLEGYVTAPPAAGWTPKAQQRVKEQMQKWAPIYRAWAAQKKQQDAAVKKATGYSPEDYARAQKIKQKSTWDVVIEAGGAILSEFLGIEDIKGCFGGGDIGSCISMVINIIPWSKLFKLGSLIGAVKKAWKAVSNFRSMQKWADRVTNAVSNARKRFSSSCHSFRADTLVRMADGSTKPISQIALGDTVLATDPATGRTEPHEVVTLHTNLDRDFVDLTVTGSGGELSDGVVHTTENHPIWSDQEQSWVTAGQLAPGDQLLGSDGRRVEVAQVHRYTGAQLMHDLTVDQVHSYYVVVGDSDVLVHNNSSYCVHSYPGQDPDKPCPVCNATGGRGNPDGRPHVGAPPEVTRTNVLVEADSAIPTINDGLQTGNGGDVVTGAVLGAAVVVHGLKVNGQRVVDRFRRGR